MTGAPQVGRRRLGSDEYRYPNAAAPQTLVVNPGQACTRSCASCDANSPLHPRVNSQFYCICTPEQRSKQIQRLILLIRNRVFAKLVNKGTSNDLHLRLTTATMPVGISHCTMLTAAQTFIQEHGRWLLPLWIFREVMGILLRGYRSSSVCGPSNSDTRVPQAMLADAITVIVLYTLLAGVSIVALLLWIEVLRNRRELVRLQSRPPGETAEYGTSLSFD
jgi:hypothetical protein